MASKQLILNVIAYACENEKYLLLSDLDIKTLENMKYGIMAYCFIRCKQ